MATSQGIGTERGRSASDAGSRIMILVEHHGIRGAALLTEKNMRAFRSVDVSPSITGRRWRRSDVSMTFHVRGDRPLTVLLANPALTGSPYVAELSPPAGCLFESGTTCAIAGRLVRPEPGNEAVLSLRNNGLSGQGRVARHLPA